jgi:hypothetical protein
MTYDAAIPEFSSPCKCKEAVMCYDYREYIENRRQADIGLSREIAGTAIFTAGTVGAILFVLTVFIL